jgi:hypothetical protein
MSTQIRQRVRIVVPQRPVNGGFDLKFEVDPYNVKLHGLMTGSDYTTAISTINDHIKPARQTSVDTVLLGMGPLMLPLAVWGVRHSKLMKKRKRLLNECIENFNDLHPTLCMRWNRRPESSLTIERRHTEGEEVPGLPNSAAIVLYQDQAESASTLPPPGQYVLPGGRPNFHASPGTKSRDHAETHPISSHQQEPEIAFLPPPPQQQGYVPPQLSSQAPTQVMDLLS